MILILGLAYLTSITSEVEGLETTITGLMTAVNAIQTSIGGLETTVNGLDTDYTTELAELAAGLEEANTAIASLTEALGNVLTEEDLATISSTLADVQADVKELLAGNAVINQNITINNDATLQYAETLVSTDDTDPNVIVSGNVNISINTTNFDAAEIARVNAIAAKLATVLGSVTISNTSSPSIPVELTNLSFIDDGYTVSGAGANDDALRTISGNLTISHGGAADYSKITSVGGNVEVSTMVTSLDLSGAMISGGVNSVGSTMGTIVLPSAKTVDVGTASVHTVNLAEAETVNLGHTMAISSNVWIQAPKATSVNFASSKVSGTFVVAAKADATVFNAPNLTTTGASTITAQAANLNKLTRFGGVANITATTLSLPELSDNASGTISVAGAKEFITPKFAISSNVMLADAENVEILTGSDTYLTAAKAKTIKIVALGNTTGFDASGYAALETLNVTGKVNTNPSSSNVTSTVTIGGTTLKTVSIAGMVDSVGGGTAVLTSLTTTGNIRSFTVNGAAALESISIGHDHIAGSGEAALIIDNNAKLTSVDLSSVNDVGRIQITNNALLTSFIAPTTSPLTEKAATIVATVTDNKLQATYTPGTAIVSATATTPEIPAVDGSFVQASVYGLRLWLEAHYSHTASPTFNIEIDAVDSDADGMFDDGDYATVAAADTNNTSDNGANQIDIPAELKTIKKE